MRNPLLLACAVALSAGYAQQAPVRRMTVTPEGGPQRIALRVDRALAGNDELVLWSPTRRVTATLVFPDGTRITEEQAGAQGVDWVVGAKMVDSEQADAPLTVSVRFLKSADPGEYGFEIVPKELSRTVEVTLALRTETPVAAPPIVMRGPEKASPKAQLDWTVDLDEESAVIDILVTDPDAKVMVIAPNNLSVDARNAKSLNLRWRTTENPAELDPPGSLFSISGFYLPYPGTHHVVNFPRAPRGPYKVVVESGKGAEVRTAFIAAGRMMQTAYEVIERVEQPHVSEIKMAVDPVPGTVHVGDNVPLTVAFNGEPVRRPIDFTVFAEYSGNDGATGSVKPLQLYFGWALDGSFRTYFQPDQEGSLRLKVSAKGRTVTGLPFATEAATPAMTVRPMAARYLGLWEQALDANSNTRLDRLDIHSEVEVVLPGLYRLRFQLVAPNKKSLTGEVQAPLTPGRQRMTAAFSGAAMRSLETDGPFRILDIELVRLEGDQVADRVSTLGIQMVTTAYRLAQWEQTR